MSHVDIWVNFILLPIPWCNLSLPYQFNCKYYSQKEVDLQLCALLRSIYFPEGTDCRPNPLKKYLGKIKIFRIKKKKSISN